MKIHYVVFKDYGDYNLIGGFKDIKEARITARHNSIGRHKCKILHVIDVEYSGEKLSFE